MEYANTIVEAFTRSLEFVAAAVAVQLVWMQARKREADKCNDAPLLEMQRHPDDPSTYILA